ncbi:MAG: DUF4349 domain-containing protein [Candidatus Omnitrophota bacterium]
MKNKVLIGIVIGLLVLGVAAFSLSRCFGGGRTCGLNRVALSESFVAKERPRSEAEYDASRAPSQEVAATRFLAQGKGVPASLKVSSGADIAVTRKLIKNAFLRLEVKDCARIRDAIVTLVGKKNGIVMNAQLDQDEGASKNGTVIFKIEPKELEVVLADVKRLGKVKSESVTVEDVTEAYVDLQARLRNLIKVRDRFVNILDDKAKQVKDIVEIERELARVGGEIEALEGRLKYLDSQIDLSTVTVNFYEIRVKVLGSLDLGRKFREAMRTAVEAGINVVYAIIVIIGMAFPFVVAGVLIWGVVIFIKKLRGKNK